MANTLADPNLARIKYAKRQGDDPDAGDGDDSSAGEVREQARSAARRGLISQSAMSTYLGDY